LRAAMISIEPVDHVAVNQWQISAESEFLLYNIRGLCFSCTKESVVDAKSEGRELLQALGGRFRGTVHKIEHISPT
jgi:hypothetical protein